MIQYMTLKFDLDLRYFEMTPCLKPEIHFPSTIIFGFYSSLNFWGAIFKPYSWCNQAEESAMIHFPAGDH